MSDIMDKEYNIRYYGRTPLIASVSQSTVTVHTTRDCDSDSDCDNIVPSKCEKILELPYEKVFIGDNAVEYRDPSNVRSPGNSILVKDSSGLYTFIGHKIYSFTPIEGDTIVKYYSHISGGCNPYPYAVGEKYIYFMLPAKTLPVEKVDLSTPVYYQYSKKSNSAFLKTFDTTRIYTSRHHH